MEDQERIEGEEEEDVEAHRRKAHLAAEDAPDETDGGGDDVEAHMLRRPPTSGG